MSIHGIRTRGAWQKSLDRILSKNDFETASFDYGDFSTIDFLLPAKRQQVVDKFIDFYLNNTDQGEPSRLPSIVAHSHGTFVIGKAMLAQPAIRFDKIILCGSILPRAFDWELILERNQAGLIRNEYSPKDLWPLLASRVSREMGTSGRDGFSFALSAALTQICNQYGKHGDAYSEVNLVDQWLPFLEERANNFEIVYGRSIGDFTKYDDFFAQSGQIDLESYTEDQQIPDGVAESWIRTNPAIYTFLMDRQSHNRRMLGYANVMPLEQSAYDKVLLGELEDPGIRATDILPYNQAGPVNLYFMSIAITPDSRSVSGGVYQLAFERLLHAVVRQCIDFARNYDVVVREISAVATTDYGTQLCSLLGMDQIGCDRRGRPIFRVRLGAEVLKKPHLFSGFRRLIRAQEKPAQLHARIVSERTVEVT